LVVFQLKDSLSLTAGRRLQLAAKAGKSTGLALISEGQGSNAAETRWRCAPVFDAEDSTLQSWELIKNKSGTLSVWHVRWNATSRRLHVVPAPSKR
jgi:protein ImuA